MTFAGFPADTIAFLDELSQNNNRPWFDSNRDRYEASFIGPSLEFITAMEQPLKKVAPCLEARSRKVGGSLMRIFKDTRFSKDKAPYKTNVGIQFRHVAGKDVHAPGVYLHIAPDECFLGVGMWRPDSQTLAAVRAFIDEQPQRWKRGFHGKSFSDSFRIYDDRLKTVPRGYAVDHPMIDDLRLKSFLGVSDLTPKQIQSKQLIATVTDRIKSAKAMMQTICEAIGQPY